jgi:DNA-binding NtrC family response regulator
VPSTTPNPPVVAIFNTSRDLVDMLRGVFEVAGYVVVSLLTHQIREGDVNIEAFLRQHNPNVIVYDIAPPYEPNWRLFQHVCQTPSMRDCHIVLTSTNAARVAEMVGTNRRIYEIVGKPVDLDQLVNAVRDAAHARPVAD